MGSTRFDYLVEVPRGVHDALPWSARLREDRDPPPRHPAARRQPSVGPVATVVLEDFEARVGVLRTRVRFIATDDSDAAFKEMSFVVDRRFARMLQPHDVISAARGPRGGFGVSVMRDGCLVAAVGAVTAVPLGDVVQVRFPADLARDAAAVYRARDPRYQPREIPVEIVTDEGPRLMHSARARFGRYEFFVVSGFVDLTECVAITCVGLCPEVAATLTAPVINAADSVAVVPWKSLQDLRRERDREVSMYVEQARECLARGDLGPAREAVLDALWRDRDCEAALTLRDEIDRRRG